MHRTEKAPMDEAKAMGPIIYTTEDGREYTEARIRDEVAEVLFRAEPFREMSGESRLAVLNKATDSIMSLLDWQSAAVLAEELLEDETSVDELLYASRQTVSNVIEEFKRALREKMDLILSDRQRAEIMEKINSDHPGCFGYFEVASYGSQNISLECTNCNAVILDSGLIDDSENISA